MKFTILFASCLIFAIIHQADCGLVKDFFGKVQKTAEVVREDVRKVWRPVTGTESSTGATPDDKHEVATPVTNKQEVATPATNKQEVATPASNKPEVATPATNAPEVKPADKKEDGNVAPLSGESEKKSEEVSKPSLDTIKPEEKEENHQEASTISPSTTTVKEGRENFKAKCATGYGRTPDGRCKPTF